MTSCRKGAGGQGRTYRDGAVCLVVDRDVHVGELPKAELACRGVHLGMGGERGRQRIFRSGEREERLAERTLNEEVQCGEGERKREEGARREYKEGRRRGTRSTRRRRR
jgi:hypothetical protein